MEDADNQTTFDSEDKSTASRLLYAASILDLYYTPLLCFFGVLGNCLSITVFCFNNNGGRRNLSSTFYLSALALSDNGFLINLFSLWLDGIGFRILSTNFGCIFIMFSSQATCFLSVWLTVAFTVERYFAVCSPLKRPLVCTVSKAKKVICGLTIISLIGYSYVLIIAKVMSNEDMIYNFNHDSSASDNSSNPSSALDNLIYFPSAELEKNNPLEELISTSTTTGFYLNYYDDSDSSGLSRRLGMEKEKAPISETLGHGNYFWMNNETQPDGNNQETKEDIYSDLMCTVPQKYMTISIIANYMDSIITLIIPLCLIAFFNMRITLNVWKIKEERQKIVALLKINNRRDSFTSSALPASSPSSNQNSRQERLNFKRDLLMKPIIRTNQNVSNGDNEKNRKQKVRGESNSKENRKIKWNNVITGVYGCGSMFQMNSSLDEDIDVTQSKSFSHGHGQANDAHSSETNLKLKDSRKDNDNGRNKCCSNQASHGENKSKIGYSSSQAQQPDQVVTTDSTRKKLNLPKGGKFIFRKRNSNKRKNTLTSSNFHSSSENRVTKMLLLVSSVFLLLNLPSHALRGAAFIQKLLWEDDRKGQQMLQASLQISNILLFNTNFAVNFFLYCLSGHNFRKSLKNILFGKHKNNSLHNISRKFTKTTVQKRNNESSVRETDQVDQESTLKDEIIETEGCGFDSLNQSRMETTYA